MPRLPDDILQRYERAGEIAAKVREEAKLTIKEGMPIIKICEQVEEMTRKMGGKPAFPCNVSINEVAAHYTSPPNDVRKIPEGGVVKIDIGVHIDGYIADTATTVCLNPEYEEMVHASVAALERAIKMIRPRLEISKLGAEIQNVIERHGFKPISNLTGHQLGRYIVHTGRSLYNVSHFSLDKIQEGNAYAIEPFVTVPKATGRVKDGFDAYIFRLAKKKLPRNAEEKRLFKSIEAEHKTLPFAERWLKSYGLTEDYRSTFSRLLSSKRLKSYPILVEASGQCIAQSEHTVYVNKNRAVVSRTPALARFRGKMPWTDPLPYVRCPTTVARR